MSPEVGQLDEDAVERALSDDPDAVLGLLADLTSATDSALRELARRLAGRLVVDLARRGAPRQRGVGRLRLQPFDDSGNDLDIDASIEGLVNGQGRVGVDLDALRARGWAKPGTAWSLLVDRSGSMGGERLSAAALAAAAVAWRSPSDYSVLAFAADVVVVKSQDAAKPPERVVNELLALRGHGTTDLALALRAASDQLQRSRAGRRLVVLLSDCRATVAGDVAGAARHLDELVIVPPADDATDAEELARSVGARCLPLAGASAFPALIAQLV